MTLSAEGVDKIGNKIFFGGARFEDFFFVFDDDLIVGDLDNFFTRNKELWVDETLDERAFDDYLLNDKAIGINGVIDDLAKLRTFFGFYFERGKIEIEFNYLVYFDNIGR